MMMWLTYWSMVLGMFALLTPKPRELEERKES